MASETQEVIVSSSTTRGYVRRITPQKQRLRVIFCLIIGSIGIAAAVVPMVIFFMKRAGTTTMATVSTSSEATTTAEMTATAILTTTSFTTTTPIIIMRTTAREMTTSTKDKVPTTTITTSTTSVTTSERSQWIKPTNETVYAIWNTTAGENSTPAAPGTGTGTYWPSEPPEAAVDNNLATEYTNHGLCRTEADSCGLDTGFYMTFDKEPFILTYFSMGTNRAFPARDPLTITIEGSNQNESALTLGTSWTLIYNGSTQLGTDPGRSRFGSMQTVPNSIWPFSSYRLLVTSKRDDQNSASFSELMMGGTFP